MWSAARFSKTVALSSVWRLSECNTAPLRDASLHLRVLERALELADIGAVSAETKDMVRTYNEEDCLSAWKLRGWLERLRSRQINEGHDVPRPEPQSEAPSENLSERQARADAVMRALLEDVPLERAERTDEQHARWLLAHILEVSRQRGYEELFLETGSHPAFDPARALYRSVGFRECGPFGAYEENGFSIFMSLSLIDGSEL